MTSSSKPPSLSGPPVTAPLTGQCPECATEIDSAMALRRRASGLLAVVLLRALRVLRCAVDRRYPALAPLHPDLVFGLQLEGRLIQTSDPNLDVRVAGIGRVKEPRPTAGAEAATVIARDLAAHLKRLDGPVRIHGERTARLLSAIRAVAAPDMHRVTANAVADRPAETSAGAYSCLHARRCYATLRWASVLSPDRRRTVYGQVRGQTPDLAVSPRL